MDNLKTYLEIDSDIADKIIVNDLKQAILMTDDPEEKKLKKALITVLKYYTNQDQFLEISKELEL